jgi:hypothetical protein
MNLLTIFVFVLIIILMYLVYKLMSKTTVSVSGFSDASNTVVLPCSKFGTSTNSNYGYSVWLYIDNWVSSRSSATNIDKNVLTRHDVSNTAAFRLYLDNDQNNLNLLIGTSNPACIIRNVQLQKWINITISVYGNTADMYLDGKLVRTCVMNKTPNALKSEDTLYIGGGYGYTIENGKTSAPYSRDGNLKGYISSVVYKANYFTPEEAWSIYSDGYSGAGMFDFVNKYKLNFSITNDNQTLGQFSV